MNGNGEEAMTVSTPEEVTQPYDIVVQDSWGPRSIRGWQIVDVSWTAEEARKRGYVRWTDIALYRVVNNSSATYMIQILGRSVVYHRNGGPCSNKGVSMLVGKLSDETEKTYLQAVPCQEPGCKPEDLSNLQDHDRVQMEVTIPRLYRCKDAGEVVDVLFRHGRRADGEPSNLNMKLLSAASALDPDIQLVLLNTERD